MARGPLPTGNARRRNEPTIPTTILPAEGFAGPAPRVPKWIRLDKAGRAWWKWAWRTPQAAAWAKGHEAAIARRAQLEDDLVALGAVEGAADLAELLKINDREELYDAIRRIVSDLKALASGKLAILKEIRELDDRLGLSPKAMAGLRWKIGPPEPTTGVEDAETEVTSLDERRARLVDGAS